MATIAFDLNGTLLDPAKLAEPLGGDTATAHGGLDAGVAYAMALTLAGGYRPFPELVESGLRRQLELAGKDPDLASEAVALATQMPPFPEAEGALETLAAAGHTLVVLTNSARGSAEEALTNAGLREHFAAVRGTDEVQAFKPDPRVYAMLEPDQGETWLVAAHWWDMVGAGRAGLRTGWVARKEQVLMPGVEVDVTGPDLQAVADAIVAATS